jgi:putative monooxygenase
MPGHEASEEKRRGGRAEIRKVAAAQSTPNSRHGAELRVLLSPGTVGATSGFMGIGTLGAGERIGEHYHPYSEEFLYVVEGSLELTLDGGQVLDVAAGEAVLVPIGTRHRLVNRGTAAASIVFHASPLAPRPDLGHVSTEGASGG